VPAQVPDQFADVLKTQGAAGTEINQPQKKGKACFHDSLLIFVLPV
jgi:hypothetical protein